MVKVFSAANVTEAHIIKGMLEANNIDAYVGGFYLQGGIGELSAMDFASVSVDNQNVDKAREIIASYEN